MTRPGGHAGRQAGSMWPVGLPWAHPCPPGGGLAMEVLAKRLQPPTGTVSGETGRPSRRPHRLRPKYPTTTSGPPGSRLGCDRSSVVFLLYK